MSGPFGLIDVRENHRFDEQALEVSFFRLALAKAFTSAASRGMPVRRVRWT